MSSQILKVNNFQNSRKRNLSMQKLVEESQNIKIRLYNRHKKGPLRIWDRVKQILKNSSLLTLTDEEKQLLQIEKKVYCKCKQKSNKNLLQCSSCACFFHIQCHGLKDTQMKAQEMFFCTQCIIKQKSKMQKLNLTIEKEAKYANISEEKIEVEIIEETQPKKSLNVVASPVKSKKESQKPESTQNGKETISNGKKSEVIQKRKHKKSYENPEEKFIKKQKHINQPQQVERQKFMYGYYPPSVMMLVPHPQHMIQSTPIFNQIVNQQYIPFQGQCMQSLPYVLFQ